MPAQPPPFPCGSFVRNCSAWAAMLLLLLSAGLGTAFAADFCVNPGFEDGPGGGGNSSAPPWVYWGGTGGAIDNPFPTADNSSARVWSNFGNPTYVNVAAQNNMSDVWVVPGTTYHVHAQYYIPSSEVLAGITPRAGIYLTLQSGTAIRVLDPRYPDSPANVESASITNLDQWVTYDFDWVCPSVDSGGNTLTGPTQLSYASFRWYGGDGTTIPVNNPGGYIDNCQFSSSAYTNINGFVKDTGGNPIAGATVVLSSDYAPSGLVTNMTLADGSYTFSNWVPYNATVYVNATQLTHTSTGPQSLLVSAISGTVPVVTMTAVTPTYNISGTVTGLPSGGTAQITASSSAGSATATTALDGTYSIQVLSGYTYTVSAVSVVSGYVAPSQSVAVSEANVSGIDFTMILAPTRYEAEDASLSDCSIIDDPLASGGARVAANTFGGGDLVSFEITVPTAGLYQMDMGYYQPWDPVRYTFLTVNSVPEGTIAAPNVAAPNYGSATTYVTLNAGYNEIDLGNGTDTTDPGYGWGPHWDYIDIASAPTTTATVSGTVTEGGVGYAGAVVTATQTANLSAVSTSAPTDADGNYSVSCTVGQEYQLSVSSLPAGTIATNVPAAFTPADATPITGKNIQLGPDPNYDPNLLFSIHSSDFTAGNNWPTVEPAGTNLVNISGKGGTSVINGQQWEYNTSGDNGTADGFRFGSVAQGDTLPMNGGTIVTAIRPLRTGISDPYVCVVSVLLGQFELCVQNDTGLIQVGIGGATGPNFNTGISLPNGQIVVLSLVVQPTGQAILYTNGVAAWSANTGFDFTSLTAQQWWGVDINVGKGWEGDGWSSFNGNIGDTYVYQIALDDTTRTNLEASLMAKFGTAPIYTITATGGGAGGSITPAGAVSVPAGLNQAFTITPAAGYVQNVTVDGVSQGAITSYTFTNVVANHTIGAAFTQLPAQMVSGTVTNSSGAGIPNATVYFSTSTNASASPIFTVVTDGSGNYTQALYNATWYASASAATNLPSGDITFTTAGVPLTGENIGLVTGSGLNVPQQANLLYSALAANCQGTNAPWPTFMPNGLSLTAIGTPSTVTDGNNIAWENNAEEGDGFRFFKGIYGPPSTTIPMNGGTIVVVCQPAVGLYGANGYQCLVSCFLNHFSICVDRSTGDVSIGVQAGSGGPNIDTGVILNSGQSYVLSLVVQPAGGAKLYVNGAQAWTGSTPTLTSITPEAYFNVDLNLGIGWEGDTSAFIGLIGDAFIYNTALNATDRTALENSLFTKFDVTPAPTYNWAGSNNGNWSNPANWNNTVPAVGNLAVFSDNSSAGATVQLDTPVSVLGIDFNNLVPTTTIASSAGNTLTFDDGTGLYSSIAPITVGGGSNTISAAVEALAGIGLNGPGELKLTGSTDIGLDSAVNPALVVQGGGTLELAGPTTLDFTRSTRVQGGGTLIISGAFTSSDADQIIGTISGTANVVLNGTGSWIHTGSGAFQVGNDTPGVLGTVTVNDNAVLDTSADGPITLSVGWDGGGSGAIVQNGGLVKTIPTATPWRTSYGPGMVLGNWNNSPGDATYSLNGGTLVVPNIGSIAWQGDYVTGGVANPALYGETAVFNMNGGILQSSDNDETDTNAIGEGTAHLIFNTTHTWVQAGGAKIDVAGHANSIAVVLEHDAALGATLDGGLHVMDSVGGGTLTLLDVCTYTGPLTLDTGVALDLAYTGNQDVSGLTVGGVAQAPGVYGSTATNPGGVFSGPGTVTVVVPPPPMPVLPLAGFTRPGGVPTFTFNTVSGYKYQVVYKNNLTDATWTVVPPGYVTSTGAPMTVQDTTAAGQPHRFYLLETANP